MSGGSKQTTTSNSEPWSAAQPMLKDNLELAGKIGPANFNPFPGSTVTPYSSQTMGGFDYMQDVAQNNMSGGLGKQMQGVIGNKGLYKGQTAAMDRTGQIGQQAFDPSNTEMNLADMARGSQIGSSNPYFEDALRASTERARDAVDLSTASAGRYGSGAHTQVLARELGDLQTQARAGQVNQDISNMVQANQMMDSQNMARLGLGLGAASNQFNMGQQAFGNLGAAYQGAMLPGQTMTQIGSAYEDLNTRLMNDQIRLFEGQQRAPLQAIEWRNAIASGAGSMGGTSSSTAQGPGQNPFATALGYGLTGAGALGSFF